jgi:hypothetical protein
MMREMKRVLLWGEGVEEEEEDEEFSVLKERRARDDDCESSCSS